MGSMWKMLGNNIVVYMVVLALVCSFVGATVTYDGRSFMINGRRKILISGSIHYPRSTSAMWPDLIQKAKAGGFDMIQTYVFWNVHEPSPGQYNFQGNADLVKFLKLVQAAGLYAHLRIGPYICAEWNLGGFPVWLKYVPGIEFRTDNGPFKEKMQGFVTKIVDLMKSNSLFESQGGPIIMSQIENEYGPVEWEIGAPGKAYSAWAAKMAVAQNTGVPWVMCKQDDAPDLIIDACNGFYCEGFKPNKDWKPKMFTEAWTGWYTQWGGPNPHRPAEDVAFSIARFVHNNGSFFNYYMFHGGTNFGPIGSGLFVTTSYDYDAPIDEYGLPNEPKYTHLTNLHKAIKQAEPALVSTYPSVIWYNKNQEAHVFKSKTGDCAAFLSNYDPANSATVTFQNLQYTLPPWSISILPDCKTVVFNTAQVKAPTTWPKFTPVSGKLSWQSFNEWMPSADDKDTFAMNGLSEQISVTRDNSDYLWYMTDVTIDADEGFLKGGQGPLFTVMSAGHALHVFINGELQGTAYGSLDNTKITFSKNVKLNAGINKIALLSVSVGLANVGVHFEQWRTGVLGPVTLSGLKGGTWDMSKWKWSYKIGLHGESQSLYSLSGSSSVEWVQGSSVAYKTPVTWYKTTFTPPPGNDPVAIDMGSMGKGEIWVNGQSIGRHWAAYIAKGNCDKCNYAGTFTETKCQLYCGTPSQRWYHIPRSWLNSGQNFLVVFEEFGGDPYWMNLAIRTRA